MTKFISTIVILVLAAGSASHYAQDARLLAKAEKATGDKFKVTTRTSKGANVYAVNKPSATVLKAIDKGLADLFAVAKKNNYRKRLNYSDYSIFIGKADRTKDSAGQYSPDIAVNAGQYRGSVYDQGGYIYAAGMVISNEPCAFVFAEHTKDFDRISNVVRYEGEHIVLYHNDRKRWSETADHSKGGGHPILQ
ncbi:MAG: hypothetical protein ACKVQW_15660 [Pyrinomonadaceae bacterium]